MGVLFIVLAVLLLLLASEMKFSSQSVFQRPGWEIATDVVAFDVNGEVTSPPPVPSVPGGTQPNDPSNPYPDDHIPGVPGHFTVYKFNPAPSLQWDFDAPTWGMPDIIASSGDIFELNSTLHQSSESNVGNYKYVMTYHEYLFDVQIRTLADMSSKDLPSTTFGLAADRVWTHETSMPFQFQNMYGAGGLEKGMEIKGFVYVRFSTLPWGIPDYGPIPIDFDPTQIYWVGVMNAKCESVVTGFCDSRINDADVNDKGWARGMTSVGGPINMGADDGTFAVPYAEVPWDSAKILDPDIRSTVILELPFDMMAGAISNYNWMSFNHGGAIDQCKPVDYYVTYTIRMECFVVKEYQARDPNLPVNPSRISAPSDWVGYNVQGLWEKYGLWIIIAGVIFVILLILATLIGLPLLWFMGGR